MPTSTERYHLELSLEDIVIPKDDEIKFVTWQLSKDLKFNPTGSDKSIIASSSYNPEHKQKVRFYLPHIPRSDIYIRARILFKNSGWSEWTNIDKTRIEVLPSKVLNTPVNITAPILSVDETLGNDDLGLTPGELADGSTFNGWNNIGNKQFNFIKLDFNHVTDDYYIRKIEILILDEDNNTVNHFILDNENGLKDDDDNYLKEYTYYNTKKLDFKTHIVKARLISWLGDVSEWGYLTLPFLERDIHNSYIYNPMFKFNNFLIDRNKNRDLTIEFKQFDLENDVTHDYEFRLIKFDKIDNKWIKIKNTPKVKKVENVNVTYDSGISSIALYLDELIDVDDNGNYLDAGTDYIVVMADVVRLINESPNYRTFYLPLSTRS